MLQITDILWRKYIVLVRRFVQVTVNQDKTSKQIAAMRVEIMQLQEELNEYKSVSREPPPSRVL